MSSLPRPAAVRQSNTTGEIFRVLSAAVLLLLSFSSRQDYKQDVEVLVDFTHTNSGLYLDYKLHSIPFLPFPKTVQDRSRKSNNKPEPVHCIMFAN